MVCTTHKNGDFGDGLFLGYTDDNHIDHHTGDGYNFIINPVILRGFGDDNHIGDGNHHLSLSMVIYGYTTYNPI